MQTVKDELIKPADYHADDVGYYRCFLMHCIKKASEHQVRYRPYDEQVLHQAARNFLTSDRNDFLEVCIRADMDYGFVLHVYRTAVERQKRLFEQGLKHPESDLEEWLCKHFKRTRSFYRECLQTIARVTSGRLAAIMLEHGLHPRVEV